MKLITLLPLAITALAIPADIPSLSTNPTHPITDSTVIQAHNDHPIRLHSLNPRAIANLASDQRKIDQDELLRLANYKPNTKLFPQGEKDKENKAKEKEDKVEDEGQYTVAQRAQFRLDKMLEFLPDCMGHCFQNTYKPAGCSQKDDFLCFCR